MKVEELSRYGKTLTTIPEESMKPQTAIMLRTIRKKFGVLGLAPLFVRVFFEQSSVKRRYAAAYRDLLKLGKDAAKELPMLVAMFNIVARKEGRDAAYEFLKDIFQQVAAYSMPAFYQIDELVKCEGDRFDNFATFTNAWFKAMQEAGTYKVQDLKQEPDKLTFTVTECLNCVLCTGFGAPEVAKLGCDHDLAGYPVILDKVDAEFRRPHTMAKGDDYCDFAFYRKGTAPDTEHLNK
jgi:hypothetical protein